MYIESPIESPYRNSERTTDVVKECQLLVKVSVIEFNILLRIAAIAQLVLT